MNPSILPPRGIFVPTRMIFNTQLPSSVLVTWIQLRSLAWKGWSTPPLSLPELASLLGIHPARLQKHLAQLQDDSALACQNTRDGKLIVSFPEEPTYKSENQSVAVNLPVPASQNSPHQASPEHASYFPDHILGYLSFDADQDGFEITNDLETLRIGLEKVVKCD